MGTSGNTKSSLHIGKPKCRLLFYSAGLTATTAFAAAAAAIVFRSFRFEHELPQQEECAGKHDEGYDNILKHHKILELIW